MAQFTAVLSFLLVLAAYATAHKTITTTVVVEEESNPTQRCKEMVQSMDFNPCMQFLGGSSVAMSLIVSRPGKMSESLRSCCQQLQKVENQCQCDAVGAVIAQHETQVGGTGAGSAEMKVVEGLMLSECGMLHCERGQSF